MVERRLGRVVVGKEGKTASGRAPMFVRAMEPLLIVWSFAVLVVVGEGGPFRRGSSTVGVVIAHFSYVGRFNLAKKQ
jgi:hypothetical protein